MKKKVTYTIKDAQADMSVKSFLSGQMGLSRREITRLSHDQGILLNGETCRLTQTMNKGDVLQVVFVKETGMPQEPDILYEDEHLVIINKPPGLASHRQSGNDLDAGTLLKRKYGDDFVIRTVGRLDRPVSGIMVYAKDRKTAAMLSAEREDELLHKAYLAFAGGIFENKSGTLTYSLGKEAGIKGRQVTDDGKECITDYEVLEEYGSYSLLRIVIRTGRTHQIRAGMAAAGHPLLGDSLYHGNTNRIRRPALHCAETEFVHPYTRKQIRIECPLPADMGKLRRLK